MPQISEKSVNLTHLQQLKESAGAFYPSFIRMAGAGMQFLITILIARHFKGEGSATFFFWTSILLTSAPIASYGLEQLALRDVPRLHYREGLGGTVRYLVSVRWISLALSFLYGLILVAYAGISDGFALWHILIPVGLAAMSAVLINGEVLKGLSHPVLGVFFGHFVPVSLFLISAVLFAGIEGQTSVGMLCIWITCFVAGALLVRFSGKAELKGTLFTKPDPAILKPLLREGFPVWWAVIFGALGFLIPLIILKETRPEAEVSFVTTAFRLSILFLILSGAVHSVFAPSISRAAESHDSKSLFQAYRKAVGFSLLALAPPMIVGICFPEYVMLIFGKEFQGGAGALRLFFITNLLSMMLGPVLQLTIMMGFSDLLPRIGACKLTLAVVLAAFWTPKYGGVGMVLAVCIACILEEIIALLWISNRWRKLRAEPQE